MIYNLLCFKSKPTVKPYIIPLHLGTALAAWCASACRHVVSTWCAVDQGKGAVDEAGWTIEAAEAKGTAVEATEEEVRGRVSMEKGVGGGDGSGERRQWRWGRWWRWRRRGRQR